MDELISFKINNMYVNSFTIETSNFKSSTDKKKKKNKTKNEFAVVKDDYRAVTVDKNKLIKTENDLIKKVNLNDIKVETTKKRNKKKAEYTKDNITSSALIANSGDRISLSEEKDCQINTVVNKKKKFKELWNINIRDSDCEETVYIENNKVRKHKIQNQDFFKSKSGVYDDEPNIHSSNSGHIFHTDVHNKKTKKFKDSVDIRESDCEMTAYVKKKKSRKHEKLNEIISVESSTGIKDGEVNAKKRKRYSNDFQDFDKNKKADLSTKKGNEKINLSSKKQKYQYDVDIEKNQEDLFNFDLCGTPNFLNKSFNILKNTECKKKQKSNNYSNDFSINAKWSNSYNKNEENIKFESLFNNKEKVDITEESENIETSLKKYRKEKNDRSDIFSTDDINTNQDDNEIFSSLTNSSRNKFPKKKKKKNKHFKNDVGVTNQPNSIHSISKDDTFPERICKLSPKIKYFESDKDCNDADDDILISILRYKDEKGDFEEYDYQIDKEIHSSCRVSSDTDGTIRVKRKMDSDENESVLEMINKHKKRRKYSLEKTFQNPSKALSVSFESSKNENLNIDNTNLEQQSPKNDVSTSDDDTIKKNDEIVNVQQKSFKKHKKRDNENYEIEKIKKYQFTKKNDAEKTVKNELRRSKESKLTRHNSFVKDEVQLENLKTKNENEDEKSKKPKSKNVSSSNNENLSIQETHNQMDKLKCETATNDEFYEKLIQSFTNTSPNNTSEDEDSKAINNNDHFNSSKHKKIGKKSNKNNVIALVSDHTSKYTNDMDKLLSKNKQDKICDKNISMHSYDEIHQNKSLYSMNSGDNSSDELHITRRKSRKKRNKNRLLINESDVPDLIKTETKNNCKEYDEGLKNSKTKLNENNTGRTDNVEINDSPNSLKADKKDCSLKDSLNEKIHSDIDTNKISDAASTPLKNSLDNNNVDASSKVEGLNLNLSLKELSSPDEDVRDVLRNLNIQLDFKVCPLHKLLHRPSRPSANEFEAVKQANLPVKTGRFTKAEDEVIKANWNRFVEEYKLDVPPQVFFKFTKRLRSNQRILFLRYLAQNLSDRLLHRVHSRFITIFTKDYVKKGSYTKEEDEQILHLDHRYKNLTNVANRLNRTQTSIYKRYELLTGRKNRGIKWTITMADKFVNHMMEITKCKKFKYLKDFELTPKMWRKLSRRMDNISIERLKKAWKLVIHPRLFSDIESLSIVKKEIIERLYKREEDDLITVNWSEVAENLYNLSPQKVYNIYKQLVYYYVPKKKRNNLIETVSYLRELLSKDHIAYNRKLPKWIYENGHLKEDD